MSLPRRLVFQCPLCDAFLEADVSYFSVSITQDDTEEENLGVGVDLSAFAKHECGETKNG